MHELARYTSLPTPLAGGRRNHVGRGQQVVGHQVGRQRGVAGDAGSFPCRDEHVLGPPPRQERLDRGAIPVVGFLVRRNRRAALPPQPPDDGAADHRPAAGDVDARPALHRDQAVAYRRSMPVRGHLTDVLDGRLAELRANHRR